MSPELAEKVDKICAKIDRLFEGYESHHQFLFGDGKDKGADERIRNVERFVEGMQELHLKIRNTIIGSAGAIVTAIIIAAMVRQ